MNINHQELEDFLFDFPDLVDFKSELITNRDIDTLRISIEVLHSGNPGALTAQITEGIKNKFEFLLQSRYWHEGPSLESLKIVSKRHASSTGGFNRC